MKRNEAINLDITKEIPRRQQKISGSERSVGHSVGITLLPPTQRLLIKRLLQITKARRGSTETSYYFENLMHTPSSFKLKHESIITEQAPDPKLYALIKGRAKFFWVWGAYYNDH